MSSGGHRNPVFHTAFHRREGSAPAYGGPGSGSRRRYPRTPGRRPQKPSAAHADRTRAANPKAPAGKEGVRIEPGPDADVRQCRKSAGRNTKNHTIQSGKSATDQSEIQHRVQAPLAALDEAPEPEPLPEDVRNRIMALREDLHPDHLRAENGDG